MLFNVKIWEPKIFFNWHQHFLVTTELPVICRIYIPINNKLRIRMRPLVFTENCHKKLKYMQEDFYLKFLNVRYARFWTEGTTVHTSHHFFSNSAVMNKDLISIWVKKSLVPHPFKKRIGSDSGTLPEPVNKISLSLSF